MSNLSGVYVLVEWNGSSETWLVNARTDPELPWTHMECDPGELVETLLEAGALVEGQSVAAISDLFPADEAKEHGQ